MQGSAYTWIGRPALRRWADGLAVVVAASLPWSSSVTSISVALWLLALLPTLDWQEVRRTIATPAGGLPVALFVFAALGMAWADVSLVERLRGLEAFLKLLAIPLLLIQFRQSAKAYWPLFGFLISAIVLLAGSFATVLLPGYFGGWVKSYGIIVKDYIAQSGEFTLAAFGCFFLALQNCRERRHAFAAALILLACAFLANNFFVISSRTSLVTIPILLAVFTLMQFSGRTRMAVIALGVAGFAAVWMVSSTVRERFEPIWAEVQQYQESRVRSSSGERLEFWRKAVIMVADAPVLGHGTGSTRELYRRAAQGQTGVGAQVTPNPHNQTLAIAIQLGLAGTVMLWAMWLSHLLLFRGTSAAAFVGLLIVIQNVIGSLFNSHLFDFTQGWTYVFGVGIAGGMAMAASPRDAPPPEAASRS